MSPTVRHFNNREEALGKPQVDIAVDEHTGRWSVDSLPMILIPLHFVLNHHNALEAELGPERLEEVFRPAGYRSAYQWCEREAAHHGLRGAAVFHHYLMRMTQRGWGRFEAVDLDPAAGTGHVMLRHSAFVDGGPRDRGRKTCYRFLSWFEGALDFVATSAPGLPSVSARELHCVSEGGHDHCCFEITPRRRRDVGSAMRLSSLDP